MTISSLIASLIARRRKIAFILRLVSRIINMLLIYKNTINKMILNFKNNFLINKTHNKTIF